MYVESLLVLLVIGAVAGYLAGIVVQGYGFGVPGNVAVGVVGAIIGGTILPSLGLFPGGEIIGQIVLATIGAVGLLLLIGLVRRAA